MVWNEFITPACRELGLIDTLGWNRFKFSSVIENLSVKIVFKKSRKLYAI